MTPKDRPKTPKPPDALRDRLRLAFIAGAEESSMKRLGRPLTREELERVLRRYPGDVCLPDADG